MCSLKPLFDSSIPLASIAVLLACLIWPNSVFAERRGFVLGTGDITVLKRDIYDLAANNAKLVRFQIILGWKTRNLSDELRRIHEIMSWGVIQQNNMVIVIDFHCPNRPRKIKGQIVEDTSFPIKDVERFVADWRVIAQSLRNYSPDNMWFELGNEQESPEWRDIATLTAKAIRLVEQRPASYHPICFSPRGVTTKPASSFVKLEIPGPQILTFHFWNWQDQTTDVQQSPVRCADPNNLNAYPSTNHTKADIQRLLDEVQMAGRRNGCQVYISECGIQRNHRNAAAFLEDFTSECRTRKIHLTLHAFREAPCWDYEGTPAWDPILLWLRMGDPFTR